MTDRARDHRADPDPDQLLTVADVAAHIGAHESTVRGWIKQGELRAAKFGTRIGWRIRRGDDHAFLRRRALTSAIARELLAAQDEKIAPAQGAARSAEAQAGTVLSSITATPLSAWMADRVQAHPEASDGDGHAAHQRSPAEKPWVR